MLPVPYRATRLATVRTTRRLHPRLTTASLALCLVLSACGDEAAAPRVPTTITLGSTTVTLVALGETHQFSPTVRDQRGALMPARVEVAWTTRDPAVVGVTPRGLITATGVGTTRVIATAGAAADSAVVTVVQRPGDLLKISGDAQLGEPGTELPLRLVVQVNDALGHPLDGIPVHFTSQSGLVSPAGDLTGSNGRTSTVFTFSPSASGLHHITATVPGTTLSTTFVAATQAGEPASMTPYDGYRQTAPAGSAVANRPAVRVTDSNGIPVPGLRVAFVRNGGSGSVTGESPVTDRNGIARVGSWILGAGDNALAAVTAAPALSGRSVQFLATGTVGTDLSVTLRFLMPPAEHHAAAFAQAELRWETLVTGDLPPYQVQVPANLCGVETPAVDEMIDDLIVFVRLEQIDGVNGAVARAGPCLIRPKGQRYHPLIGVIQVDVADMEWLHSRALLDDVVAHELGHVLGFGTLWALPGDPDSLLADPWSPTRPTADPHFTGFGAIAAFNAAGGTTYTGPRVPVANAGGAGSVNSHWRESVLRDELMSSTLNLGGNPLSRITVAALGDQGYTVNAGAADPFTLGLTALFAPGPAEGSVPLDNDLLRLPIRVLDMQGRMAASRR